MAKRKVAVVVTNRATYARIKSALEAIRDSADLELQLIAAASLLLDKYGRAVNIIEQDGFTLAAKVYMVLEGENPVTMAKTTGIGITELSTIFDNLAPDLVMTVADRYETIATAIAAAYLNIPLVHVQGGEITGSIDEKVRHAITKFANYHFVSTHGAGERVVRMGETPDSVYVTGCPSVDLAANVARRGRVLGFDPFEKYLGLGPPVRLELGRYVIVMQHPVTTEYAHAHEQIAPTLEAVHRLEVPVLWFWPNVDAGSDGMSKAIRRFREETKPTHIHFFKNMPPEDFLGLLYSSGCIVGNSSVAIREASFLGVPAVNIGNRQAGRERGPNVLDVAYDGVAVSEAIRRQLAHGPYASVPLYGDGRAGERIGALLAQVEPRIEKRLTYEPLSVDHPSHAHTNHR
jgi:UDP-hydrolysing UDP-N-acetyl-D-glucosamine 2-epimerase